MHLQDPCTPERLNSYFADRPAGYTGRYLERLGGGGDCPEISAWINAVDLVAIETLSVAMPVATSVGLLEGALGRRISTLLAQVPIDLALAEPAAHAHVKAGSPAVRAWDELVSQPNVGFVIAG